MTRTAWPRHRWPAWLGKFVLGCAVVAGSAPTAAAATDNELVVSDPGVREQVDRPPGFVTMAFHDEVDPSLANMLVQDPTGANVTTGPLVVEGTNMSSQLLDGLAPGTYTVTYRLARSDGQPQGGTFQFSFGPGTFTDAADRTWSGSPEEPEVLKNEDPNAVTPAPPPGSDPSGPASGAPTLGSGAPSDSAGPPTSAPSPSGTSPTGTTPSGTATTVTTSPATPSAGPAGSTGTTPRTAALVAGALVLVALVGAGVAVVLRRRRRPGR